MFIDRALITIKAGDGGSGITSFVHYKGKVSGGPDGGDGGKGGDIIFVADQHLSSLADYYYKTKYVAENGEKQTIDVVYGMQEEQDDYGDTVNNLGGFTSSTDKNVISRFMTHSGTVTLVDHLPGDVNGDNVVDIMDATIIAWSIVGKTDSQGNKITVERPLRDENGNIVMKKGKPVADANLRDTENVPLVEDIDAYFKREVLPYAPDAWIDKTKTKVGYEIPMTRYFYEYQKPEASGDILTRIISIEEDIATTLKNLLGKEN